ncbi:uncharacterized protein V1516DRAFT_144509 [Lipomyces oligophaga]|uniref:uncharacterized protein n=1 Tax=Lipomyces oligophaga TaxID=45792 RepID=UPI0034CFFF1B
MHIKSFRFNYQENATPLVSILDFYSADILYSFSLTFPSTTVKSSRFASSSTTGFLLDHLDDSFVPPAGDSDVVDFSTDAAEDTIESVPSSNCWTQSLTAHLLLPATEINQLDCKTMLSAFPNSYPNPTLLNFKLKFANPTKAHLMKISAIFSYLDKHTVDNNLVIIMDSYGTCPFVV